MYTASVDKSQMLGCSVFVVRFSNSSQFGLANVLNEVSIHLLDVTILLAW